jgi:hypothetical protein
MSRKKKPNPHCPVPGCETIQPHAADQIVEGLIRAFAPPVRMTKVVWGAMMELRDSICADLREKRWLAFQARLRQPEELYVRTLYALFVASDEELPHIISGNMPNGLSRLYSAVDKIVFDGNGPLYVSLPGLSSGTFTPMDTLNDGAHVSFASFMSCLGWALHPEQVPSVDGYWKYLSVRCDYLKYMHDMFDAGKRKEDVLAGVKNLHRPANHTT